MTSPPTPSEGEAMLVLADRLEDFAETCDFRGGSWLQHGADCRTAASLVRAAAQSSGVREVLKKFVNSWDFNTCGWNYSSLQHALEEARAALSPDTPKEREHG
jgi:hypothetical protein